MLYFAVLAIVSTLNNPRALVFATVLVAVHHLSLSIAFPTLIFSGANIAQNIERALFYTTITLLETGILRRGLWNRERAEKGSFGRKGGVSAMKKIEPSSGQIPSIINVIDDIAFQTNLPALNAGVEAGRAGETGKGFAVVATEVHALAHRSAEAAKEIKSFIGQSTQKITTGVELVGRAGTSIEAIVGKFNEIAASVSEVANRSDEQSQGLGEIKTGVTHLDTVT